jgi:hypothetical protein
MTPACHCASTLGTTTRVHGQAGIISEPCLLEQIPNPMAMDPMFQWARTRIRVSHLTTRRPFPQLLNLWDDYSIPSDRQRREHGLKLRTYQETIYSWVRGQEARIHPRLQFRFRTQKRRSFHSPSRALLCWAIESTTHKALRTVHEVFRGSILKVH